MLNNAQIKCMGYIAFSDYELIDGEQQIWKGNVVFDKSASSDDRVMFFSRKYDRKNSDIDRMLDEYEVKDESILGFKFLLVPKEKILFAYLPPSTIIRPNIKFPKSQM